MQTTATAYLSQISSTLTYIREYYLDLMEENDKITFSKFDRVYNYIDQSYKNGFIGDQQLFNVHGYFHQTIKKFKRIIENRIYIHSTDYDACFQKLQRQKVKLVPVFTELVLDQEKKKRLDLQSLTDFNMQHHIYTKKELCQFSLQIFELLQLDTIKVPQQQLNSLIHEICINYNVVAYHNFTHAFQLSQLLFSCYIKSQLKEYCTQLEIFSAIIAGLSHDLNHKGVNNAYKVKKSKKFNIITSETAVLENMHCATFFNLLQLNRDLDIFQHLANDEEKNNAKRLIITCILATDMGKHFKLLSKFQKRVQATIDFKNENTNELIEFQRLSKDKPEDRIFVLNIMTHACDISNPTMNFDNYMNWSYLLAQEFQDQVCFIIILDTQGSGLRSGSNRIPAIQGQDGILWRSNWFFKKSGSPIVDSNRYALHRSKRVTRQLKQKFRNFGLKTQIMIINKFLAKFCTQTTLQKLHSRVPKFQNDIFSYLDSNPTSKGVKSFCKTIFSLEQAIKAEEQYSLHHNFLQAKIQTFLKERKYEMRIQPGIQIVQLLKQSSDGEYFMTLNIFPRGRSEVPNERKESLALHEMDDFGKYFEYVPIHQPQFKEDEASRVQMMKDDRLDDLNPLGLDLDEIENLDLVITIEKKYEEQIFFIKSETTQGKFQFSGMCVIEKYEKSEDWKQNLFNQIEYYKNDYSVDFFEFSDSLQKKMVEFLKEIGLEASDSYFIEMISLYHQQHLYLEWLTVLQAKLQNNKLHN